MKIIASKLLLLLFEGENVFPFRGGNYKLSIMTCSVLLQEADSTDDQDSRAEAPRGKEYLQTCVRDFAKLPNDPVVQAFKMTVDPSFMKVSPQEH